MAGARRARPGGIGGLLELIRQRGEAIDADLRHHYPGHRLADVTTGRLTLRELRVLVRGLPHDGTALWRATRDTPGPKGIAKAPPDSWWTPERDLMATLIDLLNTQVWMQSEDGRKGRNRPKPIERPGVSRGRRMGKTSLPQEQVRALLAARGPQRPQHTQDSAGRWRDQRGRFIRREPADG